MTQALEEYSPQRVVALDTYSPVELRVRLAEMKQETDILQEFFAQVMHPSRPNTADGDYGVIPGTPRPTLLKPGAEKLLEYYGYAPTIKAIDETADRGSGFYRARVTLALVSKRTGVVVAEGVGEANTMESRYRWRSAERKCPICQAPAIIKGKAEYGGGWLCWRKKGGCGENFDDADKAITGQDAGKVENDDPWGLWNTVLKQGKKRALIDATLSATRSSGLFTQDMEELTDWVEGEIVPSAPKPTPERPVAPPQAANGESAPVDQLGEFKDLTGAFDFAGYASHLHDQTITSVAIARALGTTAKVQNTTILAWLKAGPARTLKALTELCIIEQKELEAPKPQEEAVT